MSERTEEYTRKWNPLTDLDKPLRWRIQSRARLMSDLFHPDVTDEQIDQVFAVMCLAPQHCYQVLTKRPGRMADYTRQLYAGKRYLGGALSGIGQEGFMGRLMIMNALGVKVGGGGGHPPYPPIPWVWLGTSVENQATADERIPHLLRCPAAVRFVSYEPALGPVDFSLWLRESIHALPGGTPGRRGLARSWTPALDWLIVGGESGPRARPCDVAWIRSAAEQCREAGVACFIKQLGARPYERDWMDLGWPVHIQSVQYPDGGGSAMEAKLRSRKGGDPDEWPEDLRVRGWPE